MKILTRYVLGSFLKNYLISAMVLIGLYVVLDMVFNFDEIDEARRRIADAVAKAGGSESSGLGATIGFIADYYFHHAFVFFVQLSGIIPVVAAAFTLMRMSRFNELTAVLAAGVPLLWIAAPILICGVVLNLVLLPLTQEIIIPSMIPKLAIGRDDVGKGEHKLYPVNAMQDDRRAIMSAGRFIPGTKDEPARLLIVDIIERDEKLQPAAHIKADEAIWDAAGNTWRLNNGLRVTGLQPEQIKSAEKPTVRWHTSISPEDIKLYLDTSRSGGQDFVDLLSTSKINQLLQRPLIYGTPALLKVKHFRWSQLFLNMILLALAIPCVLTREPGALKQSASKCLILVGLCMGTAFISQSIAGTPPSGGQWVSLWPLIWAWAPLFAFLPLSLVLLDRVKT